MPNYFHCLLIIADNEFNKPIENSENDNEFVLVQRGYPIKIVQSKMEFHNRTDKKTNR